MISLETPAQEETFYEEAPPGDSTQNHEEEWIDPETQSSFLTSTTSDSDSPWTSAGNQSSGDLMNFQTDLFTGRFTYSIPITVPPGRQGAQPTLALVYNSGGGNGWCGVGWNLDVGFIQRDTRRGPPIKWNFSTGQPLESYDDSACFVANFGGVNSCLVPVATNSSTVFEYRAEVDGAFLTFVYTNSSSPTWTVTDKGGNRFFFGRTSSSRMTNNRWTYSDGDQVFRWALDRVVDINGNETTLSYTTHSNMLYLAGIDYNGSVHGGVSATHTVDFDLEAADRPDATISFQPGYRVETRRRLSKIVLKVGAGKVRRYQLAYLSSPSTGRSLLDSVTVYGSDDTSSLPPMSFTYQEQDWEFEDAISWPSLANQGLTTSQWNAIRSVNAGGETHVETVDMDGDGLPDRVLRKINSPYTYLAAKRNTGSGFYPEDGFSEWNPLDHQGAGVGSVVWNSIRATDADGTGLDLVDINGDGFPDRVMRKRNNPYTHFVVQTNLGSPFGDGFSSSVNWTNVESETSAGNKSWRNIRSSNDDSTKVDLRDINGDGLPDRVLRKKESPFDVFKVQFNNGNGFENLVDWGPVHSQGYTNLAWNSIRSTDNGDTFVTLVDINGDALPDRVMRAGSSPYDNFQVEFNNGSGFETNETWGPLESQGDTGQAWNSVETVFNRDTLSTLADINADGLVDRVMRKKDSPYDRWVIQMNHGMGFVSTNRDFLNLDSPSGDPDVNSITARTGDGETIVDFFDINGDGLPDRVIRRYEAPFDDEFEVQLNKGPFPDLLSVVENNLGGQVLVQYTPSTQYKNRDKDFTTDPWEETNSVSRLPFPVYTVSALSVVDGFNNTNTTTYAFEGGYFNGIEKEFRGFNRAAVADPLGTTSITYFHQGGGRDDSAYGEYEDQASIAKKGMPYRVEVYGTDEELYSLTINKIEEVQLHSSGWYFPFISQTMRLQYEGLGTYRATAQQLQYDTNTGNVIKETNLGEVTSINAATHGFTDVGSDSLYTHTTYASLSGILNKPSTIKITSDSAGSNKMRETVFNYDSRGNMTTNSVWLSNTTYIVTQIIEYDTWGNPTETTDAAGITTTTTYDSTYKMFPVRQVTATFTNETMFDVLSGNALVAVDAKGLVSSNVFDVFFRPTASYISTNAYGSASLWRAKIDYNLGGIVSGSSSNFVRRRVFDAVDTTNGHESYAFADGLLRPIQSRVEGETGHFRVTDTFYDKRGKAQFTTLPYFSSGAGFTITTGTNYGTWIDFDPIGRPFIVTPGFEVVFDGSGAFQSMGESGGDGADSPLGGITNYFSFNSDPWISVVEDPLGKTKRSHHDAFGRVTSIVEVTGAGNYTTTYQYDLMGNLTNVTDHLTNVTTMVYDNLGRKTKMIDPDMGTWTYAYDHAGRMTEQVDAKSQKIKFFYDDPLGRMISNQVFNASGDLTNAVVYHYDSSNGDNDFTVFNGQLYKVEDSEGWEKNGYDVRGRVIKTRRHLDLNSTDYTTEFTYDDADRVKDITYPLSLATIRHTYDTGGNLSRVESLAGTGTPEVFYGLESVNAQGQITVYTNGHDVATYFTYYPISKRLQKIQVYKTGVGYYQNHTYTFDRVSNIKSVTDSAFSGSGSISVAEYDDLYRLTKIGGPAYGIGGAGVTNVFAYNAIGNVLTNGDAGTGVYAYSSGKPHAVASANGTTYAYDACGNMTTRGSQTLSYDEQNRLRKVTGPTVTFGYDHAGARLWKQSGSQTTLWIGGLYERKGNRDLCHVYAAGRRIATFEPSGGSWGSLSPQAVWWAESTSWASRAAEWPFQEGRTPLTVLLVTLTGILTACVMGRRAIGRREPPLRWAWPLVALCGVRRQSVTATALWRRRTRWRVGVDPAVRKGNAASVFAPLKRILRPHEKSLHDEDRPELPKRRHSRLSAIAAALQVRNFKEQFVSVGMIVGLIMATTPIQVEAQTYYPVFYYYHSDHLGSSNVMSDRDGMFIQRYEYQAYGKERFKQNSSAFPVSNRYTGQILDEETGLYYYNARYYDPELSRFVQADIIVPSATVPQTLNRYSYVNNNPLKYIDPSGHNFFGEIFQAKVDAVTDEQTWISVGIGAGLGLIASGGNPIGAAIGGGVALAMAIGTAAAQAGATHLAGPQVGHWTAVGITIAVSLVGLYFGVSRTNADWWIVAGSALSIASTTANATGNEDYGKALSYAALATSLFAAINSGFVTEQQEIPDTAFTIEVRGVGERDASVDLFGSRGFGLDIIDAANETVLGRLIQEGRVMEAVNALREVLNYQALHFRTHSQGGPLVRLQLRALLGEGVSLDNVYVTLNGSPIPKNSFFGIIPLGRVHSNAHFLDPIANLSGFLEGNFVRGGFGLLTIPTPLLRFHSSRNIYGFQ